MDTLNGTSPENATYIHAGRNRIWRCNIDGHDAATKRFGNSTIKSFIYIFRKSKARKSFENAQKLVSLNIGTPYPLGYGEKRDMFHRLLDSVYICSHIESAGLDSYLDGSSDKVIADFAKYVAKLHEKGILHNDLNSTNVRVTSDGDSPRFSLIDLNRMEFKAPAKPPSVHERFCNITRFSRLDSNYIHFVKKYLEYAHMPETLLAMAIKTKIRHDIKEKRIHKIKNLFKFRGCPIINIKTK